MDKPRMEDLSPMMQQYMAVKNQHKDALVFFRLGDFYEMFFDDAVTASRELELTLTGRDCGLPERAPMCGVPYHSCEGYIARLIKKGYKVAICEQMENPATAKGMVRREVIRIVTPGTLIESNLLDEGAHNYIGSLYRGEGGFGAAFADISTGQVQVTQLEESEAALINELGRFDPKEVLFNQELLDCKETCAFLKEKLQCTADLLEEEEFAWEEAKKRCLAQFGAGSLEELYMRVKSKRYPLARARRLVLAAFLGVKGEGLPKLPPYLRVLGMTELGQRVLREASPTLPLAARPGDFQKLGGQALELFQLEARAGDLYGLCCPVPQPCGRDYTQGLVKVGV